MVLSSGDGSDACGKGRSHGIRLLPPRNFPRGNVPFVMLSVEKGKKCLRIRKDIALYQEYGQRWTISLRCKRVTAGPLRKHVP
jgi:hypothetical protein